MRVGIVGGGLAGLSAAYYLRRADPGCRIDLYEAGNRWGGAIRSEWVGDLLLEHGADMFATEPDAVLRLCTDLGLADRLIKPQPNVQGAAIVFRGQPVKIPDGFVLMRPTRLLPMLRTPLLSPAGKLRLLAERWVPRRTAPGDESIQSFVTRRLGRQVLQRIVQPLVGGIYTGDVAKLSMAATMPQFLQMERQHGSLWAATRHRRRSGADSTERTSAGARYGRFRSLPGGVQELVDALVAALPSTNLHLGCPITAAVKSGGSWQLQGPGVTSEPLDHVIFATPARVAARLLGESCGEAAHNLEAIESASSAIVALAVQRRNIGRDLDVAGIVVPAAERRRILAVSFTSDKFAGRAPEDQKLIRVFFGGVLQEAILDADDDRLIAIAREELGELIGLSGQPIFARVIRWPQAMPQYHVGHLERIETLEQTLALSPGLHVIGNSLRGVGIAPTVAGAAAVAEKITAAAAGAPASSPLETS